MSLSSVLVVSSAVGPSVSVQRSFLCTKPRLLQRRSVVVSSHFNSGLSLGVFSFNTYVNVRSSEPCSNSLCSSSSMVHPSTMAVSRIKPRAPLPSVSPGVFRQFRVPSSSLECSSSLALRVGSQARIDGKRRSQFLPISTAMAT